jgi:hypothetical protein
LNNNIEESRLNMGDGPNRYSTENVQRPTQQFNHPDIVKSSQLIGMPSRYEPSTQLHPDSSEFRKPDSDSKTQQKATYSEGLPNYHNIERLYESHIRMVKLLCWSLNIFRRIYVWTITHV